MVAVWRTGIQWANWLSLAAFLWVGFRSWTRLDTGFRALVTLVSLDVLAYPLFLVLEARWGSNHFEHTLRPLAWVPILMFVLSRTAPKGPGLHLLLSGVYLSIWVGLHLSGLESIKVIKGPSVGLMSCFLMAGAMLSLAQASTRDDLLLADQPVFWVGSGVLLASAASMMMLLFLDRLMAASMGLAVWSNRVQALAQVTQTLCFLQALRCTART